MELETRVANESGYTMTISVKKENLCALHLLVNQGQGEEL